MGIFDTSLLSPGNPITNGLTAYYKLDEGSGLRFDTLVPGVGPAAKFTRANSERLTSADNADLSGGDIDFTVSCWARIDATATDLQTTVGKYTPTGDQREYRLIYRSAPSPHFAWTVSPSGTDAAAVSVDSVDAVVQGQWALLIAEHDATANELRIRQNVGSPVIVAFSGGIFNGTGGLALGADNDAGSSHLDGALRSVGIWRRKLTAQEMSELHNGGRGLRYSQLSTGLKVSLAAWWDLDEESGNRADSHTGGYTLTDTNTVTQTTGPQGNALADVNTVTSIAGKIGNAAVFMIANSEQLEAPDAVELKSTDTNWEWNGWIYLAAKATNQTIFAKDNGGAGGREFRLDYETAADRFVWTVYDGTSVIGTVTATTFGSPTAATFYFVRVYHDATNNLVGIGVNNGTVDTAATTGAASGGTTQPFRFGANGSGTPQYLGGRLDDWGRWNRILSAAEATERYAAAAGVSYPFA